MGHKNIFESNAAMQNDLDAYLFRYNTERPHQGRGMNGRTPADVFVRYLPKPKTTKKQQMNLAA